ncbi:MAG: ABC transporter substrate-binding protein [Thermomicrobiales bacterium]
MTPRSTSKNRLDRRRFLGGAAATATAAAVGRFARAPEVAAQATPVAAPTPPVVSEPVDVAFWGGEPEENGPGAFVGGFSELYDDISATYTRYVNDDTGNTQLDTALQGGGQIDVYQSYGIPRTSQRIGAGAAEDLTSYIEADEAVLAWTQSTDALYKHEGRLFSLPTVRDPYFVIANKRFLDEAEVELPAQWTVDDFRALAQQLSGDGVYGTYTPPDIARITLGPDYWYKEGGLESNFDHPAFRQHMELHRAMIDEGSAFPWTDVLAQNLEVYQQNVFLTEQIALWPTSSWVLRYVNDLEQFPHEFVTTFAPMPAPADVAEPWNPGQITNDILMTPGAKNKETAWALIRFRLVEGAHHYLLSGKQPAFPGTDNETVVSGILGENRDTLYDVAAYERAIFDPAIKLVSDSITTAAAEILQIYNQNRDRYLIGEIDIDEWVETIKQQADEAIQNAAS